MSELTLLNAIEKNVRTRDKRPYLMIHKCGKGYTGYFNEAARSELEVLMPQYNDFDFFSTSKSNIVAIKPSFNEARSTRLANNFGCTKFMKSFDLKEKVKYFLNIHNGFLSLDALQLEKGE